MELTLWVCLKLGPMVINHQVWGCPIFRQTFRQRVSLIRDTQSSSNLTLGIFAWNSRVKKGCPKIFGKHSNSKLNLPKMGLSENIGCPEIHRSLVNLPGHRYKIGTVFKHTHAIPNLKNTNLQVLGSQFSTQIGVINPAIGSITLLKHLWVVDCIPSFCKSHTLLAGTHFASTSPAWVLQFNICSSAKTCGIPFNTSTYMGFFKTMPYCDIPNFWPNTKKSKSWSQWNLIQVDTHFFGGGR